MELATVLPRRFVLRSQYNNKYLSCNQNDKNGLLLFDSEEIAGLRTKFAVENAESREGLVHIRSCYNNKYLMRSSNSENWIVAASDKPNEDQSQWSCTLFKPLLLEGNTFRLLQVEGGNYARLFKDSNIDRLAVIDNKPSGVNYDVFMHIDWDDFVFLPKYVAFKGENGSFLSAQNIDGHPYLMFSSNDIGDSSVPNEIINSNDGRIQIKNNMFNKFWRRNPNWIWADDSGNTSNPDTFFTPIKVSDKVIALRNMGNEKFCKRYTTGNRISGFSANDDSISRFSRLEVAEPVLRREIDSVEFHTDRARIYNHQTLTIGSQDVRNDTDIASDTKITLKYTVSASSTWNVNLSLNLGVRFSFTAGIPSVAQETIQISAEFKQEYQWGETIEKTTETQMAYTIKVPPKSTIRVFVVATKAACDVPFSYTQTETLTDGRLVTGEFDDGVFTGSNCYDFRIKSSQVSALLEEA